MDLPTHREDGVDGKQERSPSKERRDTPAHFFAETSPSSEIGKEKGLLDTFKAFYDSKKKLQAISKQVHSEILSEIGPFHAALQEGEDLDLSDCAKAGAFLPPLDLPNYTQEGVLIPREQRHIASPVNKEAPALSDEHILRIQGIHSTVAEYTSDFYFKKEGPEKMWSAIMKAPQVAYVLTYSQLCEHAFQEQRSSFELKMAEKIQQEFRKRRNKIEQHMGFPDILGLLKQGRPNHEQKGFLSDAMHTRLNDEYHQIEALPYNRERLQALDGFAEKLLSAQRVFALTGKTADAWDRETADHIWDKETSAAQQLRQQLRQEISQRAEGMAKTPGGWEKVRETVTKFLTDQQINPGVRICAAKALGDMGKQFPVEMRKSIAKDLVGQLDNKEINLSLCSSMAHAIGVIGEPSVVNDLFVLLDNKEIKWSVRSSVAHAIGEIGKKSSVEMKTSIANGLVGQLDNKEIDLSVRSSMASAIGVIGDSSVVNDLVGQLDNKEIDLSVRSSMASAIGEIGKKASSETRKSLANDLFGQLDKNNIPEEVRSSITHAIGVIGDSSVANDLFGQLDKNDIPEKVRISMASAIGEIGKKSPAETRKSLTKGLVQRLDKNDIPERVRISIAHTIGVIGDSSVANDLFGQLDNNELARMHFSIVKMLGEIGKKSSVEMKTSLVHGLFTRLDNNNLSNEMRSSMASAIGEIGEQSPSEMRKSFAKDLVQRLDKNDIPEEVRISIAHTIRVIGDSSVVNDLNALLDNDDIDWLLRSSITNALYMINDNQWFQRNW